MKQISPLSEIGSKIRSLRLARGYSQEALAAEADMARSYYGAIERGERNFSVLGLLRIARALNVSVIELFPQSYLSTNNLQ
ncbi:MAG: helix-turn-helix domain-containing protein [Legionellales bacterium]|nr:helix-turn-helix domain-containing protein [Legionellales bacterium]